jgi:xanthine dehydrogenase accessory factor
MNDIYQRIPALENDPRQAAFCVVVATSGSTPRKAGSKMLVFEDGRTEGTVGGGSLEARVVNDALECIAKGMPAKQIYDLKAELAMECGGTAEVYIEPLLPRTPLFVFGAGHVGRAVARFASGLGFRITLVDDREGIFGDLSFANTTFVNEDYLQFIGKEPFDGHTFIVITTHEHARDEEVLRACLHRPHAYLGMIGSRTKVATIRERLLSEKYVAPEILDTVDMPIGMKMKVETPEEIAVSIVAKLVDEKNSLKKA